MRSKTGLMLTATILAAAGAWSASGKTATGPFTQAPVDAGNAA